jgi:hypothetical protein
VPPKAIVDEGEAATWCAATLAVAQSATLWESLRNLKKSLQPRPLTETQRRARKTVAYKLCSKSPAPLDTPPVLWG